MTRLSTSLLTPPKKRGRPVGSTRVRRTPDPFAVKRRPGRPVGTSKPKKSPAVKRRPGRPRGSKKSKAAVLDLNLQKGDETSAEVDDKQHTINLLEAQVTELQAIIDELKAIVDQNLQNIDFLTGQLAEIKAANIKREDSRKKILNELLDLKGKIRIFVRVRPVLPEEALADTSFISYPHSTTLLGRGISLTVKGINHKYIFDKVVGPETTQSECFGEIEDLIQSTFDGSNVCIFAYGQTGSGKTYTMLGKPNDSVHRGVIHRSVEQIFNNIKSYEDEGWKHETKVSILEIYNETIRDLLTSDNSAGKKFSITHDRKGNTVVSGLTIVDVCSSEQVTILLEQAAQRRSVGKTQINEWSSRSHYVFTLRISGVNLSVQKNVEGVLNLIDLAGTERVGDSQVTGSRLAETQAINTSLSALTDVIVALGEKDVYIPYRRSKLTYLLEPCLGGQSKTLMFVNISPHPSAASQSVNTLDLAKRVKKIHK